MTIGLILKPAKGVVLAAGLALGWNVVGYAQDAQVPVGAQGTVALASFYYLPPNGTAVLGGHTFDLTGGNFIYLDAAQSASFTGSYQNASAVYLLLNSSLTGLGYNGQKAGLLTLTFSNGTTQTVDLVVGTNLREWRIGAGSANVVTTCSDPASAQVWIGSPQVNAGPAVIDMLTVTIPTTPNTLTGITLSNVTYGGLHLMLSGLTVDDAPVVIPPVVVPPVVVPPVVVPPVVVPPVVKPPVVKPPVVKPPVVKPGEDNTVDADDTNVKPTADAADRNVKRATDADDKNAKPTADADDKNAKPAAGKDTKQVGTSEHDTGKPSRDKHVED